LYKHARVHGNCEICLEPVDNIIAHMREEHTVVTREWKCGKC
jgi:hypothetical protein